MGQKASIGCRGNMAQKSIAAFFSKAPAKKSSPGGKEKENVEEKEIPAKTKPFQDSNSGSSSSSATPTTKSVEVIDVEGKENSNALAENETPPLRKTAVNPAFKTQYKSSQNDSRNQAEEENSTNTDQGEVSSKKNKKKEAEVKNKPSTKKEQRKSIEEKEDIKIQEEKKTSKGKRKMSSTDEDASPVKSRPKKKKAVIESDDEDETPMETESEVKPEIKLIKKSPPKKEKSYTE